MSDARGDNSLPAILGGTPVRAAGPPAWPRPDSAVSEAIAQAVADGSWGRYHGGHCAALAERLAAYHECEHALLCSSGTAAIELALRGAKVGAGDEVILAAYDFKANFQDILALGAVPVLVDLDPQNWNIAAEELERAISPATRAILVSHLHGGIVDMPSVLAIANRHRLLVVEDACQASGATVCGRKAGTWGHVGVLSFGGSKLLTAGRGGAIVSNHADAIQRIKLYAYRGNDAYPLSELQAAALLPQLEHLDAANARRAENVARLAGALRDKRGLVMFRNRVEGAPGYYKVGFQYEAAAFDGLSRDDLIAALRAEGMAFDSGFRALHLIHSGRRFRQVGELPVAVDADARVVTLHHPVLLGDAGDIAQIVEALDKLQRSATMIRERLASSAQTTQ